MRQGRHILGWTEGEDKWALISSDKRILRQEASIPEFETVKAVLARFGIKSEAELLRQYIEDHPNTPGVELLLAFAILPYEKKEDSEQDEELAHEAVRIYNKALRESPDSFVYGPGFGYLGEIVKYTNPTKPLMEPLLKTMMSNIESLLERKPSAENIWMQWLFWNKVEGKDRPLEPLVGHFVPSPFSGKGILDLPWSVLDAYLAECKKNENWRKASALIKCVWDRHYSRVIEKSERPESEVEKSERRESELYSLQNAGLHLIESYLQEGRQGEADDIFKAVIHSGSKFKEISKIVELAKAKGFERIAAEWQKAHEKQGKATPQ
jgi:hypothetical protein